MRHVLHASLALCYLFACVVQAAPPYEASANDARFYAQSRLDREFADLKLTAEAGGSAGHIVVVSAGCLTPNHRLAISQTLLGHEVKTVDWRMNCPNEPVAKVQGAASTTQPADPTPVEVEPLPAGPLFAPLLADPREARFSVNYQRHHIQNLTFDAADVSFGEYVGFAEGRRGQTRYQIGLAGGVFALFNLDSDSFDLINADYLIGIPVSWRRHAWSVRARLYHQSSHLGDEFLLGNPGVDRINLSYEVVDALVSHEWARWRLYGGGGVVVHSEPDLKRGLAQFGGEYIWGTIWEGFDLTLGADLKGTAEQDWSVNQSYRAGVGFKVSTREVRLMLQHYRGYSPNGQFFTERLNYTGLGFYFGL